ncbi:hypothetical protein PBI_SCTP2_323 [Salicola phage SCTP-2]|nr:hypothetical protein PBI_SCTP2_323 [Salicola phage SCTP-2]
MKIHNLTEDINNIEYDKFQKHINGDFSQAYERALQKDFIFKGFDSLSNIDPESDNIYYGTPVKNRESRNTYNYYTLWINNHSDWSEFPHRNVICSNNRKTAMDYGEEGMGVTCVLLPKNDTKIGVVPKPDIWEVFQNFNLEEDDIVILIKDILELKGYTAKPNFQEFEKSIKNINYDEEIKNHIERDQWIDDAFIHLLKEKETLYNFIQYWFSPTENGFDLKSVKDTPFSQSGNNNELWFDNDFIAIPLDYIKKYIN